MLKRLVLRYSWLLHWANNIHKKRMQRRHTLKLGKSVFLGFSVVLEGHNFINHRTIITNSHLGFGSYIANDSNIAKTTIGRYTSVGPRVVCVFGNHPTSRFVSTHPAFFSNLKQVGFTYTQEQLFKEFADPVQKDAPYTIAIGNDVWIGADVRILDGATIGDGAIVAAGALVNKDVAPYSIVGGVPAKHIKYRFNEAEIQFLQQLQWWDKPQAWIAQNAPLFTDIAQFMQQHNENK